MTLPSCNSAYTRSTRCFGERVMARERIVLEAEEKRELNRRVRASMVSVRDRRRAQIILLAAEGQAPTAIAAAVGVTRVTVSHW
ncbi:MAG: helix-turn-helix domain-containing protein [Thermochromatium sp.]